jgi:hypothetical protein
MVGQTRQLFESILVAYSAALDNGRGPGPISGRLLVTRLVLWW